MTDLLLAQTPTATGAIVLTVLYWVLLVVSAVFSFIETTPPARRSIALIALFVLIGIRAFPVL